MTQSSASNKTGRWIKPLPKQLINKIAAGEVVERPASVVKELVENSIDSGATRIEIAVEKSGIKSIQIVDNGCGIDEEQIEIAFSRHATSKISSFGDLDALTSYGFRGEALPSIASVSRLRMVSRTAGSRSGTEIIYEGGVLQSKKPIAAQVGTTIEVENLFYNTPARRKFLKAESTEARHISRYAMALAMGRPDIGLSYNLNGRQVFTRPGDETLGDRVAAVLGRKDKTFVAVNGEFGPLKVTGHVGAPDTAQHNRNGQFIFINNRYISSPSLAHAFGAAYAEQMPRGQFPVGALLLEVDLAEVDVNAHPAKTEVRLSREREIHDALYRIIKDALRQDGIIPIVAVSREGPPMNRETNIRREFIPGIGSGQSQNADFIKEMCSGPPLSGNLGRESAQAVKVDTSTGEIIEESRLPAAGVDSVSPSSGFRFIGRYSNLYLLLESGNSLYIVDQHTAHERVLYEEILAKIEARSVDGQRLLFPEQIELTPEQLSIFDENIEILNESGFEVAPFGGRMVNLEAVPTVLARKAPKTVFLKVIDDLGSMRKSGQDLKKGIAQSMACRAAVMAGDKLSDAEATHLLKRLLECENGYCCPHGRPTFVKFARSDLDKQFGRG